MSVKQDLKLDILFNSIGKYSNVLITFIIQMFLGRLLTPSEFGVVAVINVFLVFFQLLADFGIGPAIIQRDDLDDSELNQIYSFSVYFSIILTIVFALLRQSISTFYNNTLLLNAIPVMSLALLFNGLTMIPQNLLLKHKKFKIVNIALITGSLANGIVSIVFAYMGYSYFAIIYGNIVRAIIQFSIFIFNTNRQFYFRFSVNPLKKNIILLKTSYYLM